MFGALLKKRPLPGMCAIDVTAGGISIARLIQGADKPILEFCDFFSTEEISPERQLKKLADLHKLHRSTCASLLGSDDYQLLVTESPSVPQEERRAALRWRIKDLISDPATEITLDAFDVPPPRGSEKSSSIYVVVAKNVPLNSHCANLLNADINLKVIDIIEMAQRNIASLLPDDENGVALLSLQPTKGMLTLTKAGELYLSRPIGLGLDQAVPETVTTEAQPQDDNDLPDLDLDLEFGNTAAYDQIALELQRLLDYYESNFRQAPIRKLYLAPTLRELPGFPDHIKENLNMSVELIDLTDLFECKKEISLATQAQAFYAIGAALHRIENEPGN